MLRSKTKLMIHSIVKVSLQFFIINFYVLLLFYNVHFIKILNKVIVHINYGSRWKVFFYHCIVYLTIVVNSVYDKYDLLFIS